MRSPESPTMLPTRNSKSALQYSRYSASTSKVRWLSSLCMTKRRMEDEPTKILIVVTAAPSILTEWKGVAVSVWLVQPPGRDPHGLGQLGQVGTTLSNTMKSNDKEIALLGLVDALREVEPGQKVNVFINQTWIVEGIDGGAEQWVDRRYGELWRLYLKIVREKCLHVQGEHISLADRRFANDASLFRKWAGEALKRRARELGAPTGGFDPIEDED